MIVHIFITKGMIQSIFKQDAAILNYFILTKNQARSYSLVAWSCLSKNILSQIFFQGRSDKRFGSLLPYLNQPVNNYKVVHSNL